MKQAFVISAYQDYLMLKLILEILHKDFLIYVHVDMLSNEITDEEIADLNQMENVKVVKKYKVYWNSLNHLLALTELAQEALKNPEINYIHFSTGQDLPIKSNKEIIDFYESSGNKSFLNFHYPDAMTDEAVRNCWEYYHFFFNDCDVRQKPFSDLVQDSIECQKKNKICKTGIGEFKKVYKGIIWSSFTREALEYCFSYISNHPEYYEDIKFTRLREEFYFHTILFNTPQFKEKIVCDGKHGWNFNGRGVFLDMTYDDYRTSAKRGKLFIRKVNSNQEELINDILEKTCEYRIICGNIYHGSKIIYTHRKDIEIFGGYSENHISDTKLYEKNLEK